MAPDPPVTPAVSQTPSVRWAGALLAVGILALITSIVLYIFVLGEPTGTGPDGGVTNADFAAHITEYEALTRSIWFTEMTSSLLIAIGAFGLRERAARTAGTWPTGLFWTMVGVGATVQVASYGLTLGSYWHATAVIDSNPVLFDALRGAASVIFGVGNFALMAGIALALLAEARSSARAIPAPVGYVGAVAGIVGLGYPLSFMTGVSSLAVTAPFALLFFPIVAYFGVMIGLGARSGDAADAANLTPPEVATP